MFAPFAERAGGTAVSPVSSGSTGETRVQPSPRSPRSAATCSGKVKEHGPDSSLWSPVLFPPRPEGAGVRPAQGNALREVSRENTRRPNGPTALPANARAVGPFRFVGVPQGVALGWVNGCPFGANGAAESATATLVHGGVLSRPQTCSAVAMGGRTSESPGHTALCRGMVGVRQPCYADSPQNDSWRWHGQSQVLDMSRLVDEDASCCEARYAAGTATVTLLWRRGPIGTIRMFA